MNDLAKLTFKHSNLTTFNPSTTSTSFHYLTYINFSEEPSLYFCVVNIKHLKKIKIWHNRNGHWIQPTANYNLR